MFLRLLQPKNILKIIYYIVFLKSQHFIMLQVFGILFYINISEISNPNSSCLYPVRFFAVIHKVLDFILKIWRKTFSLLIAVIILSNKKRSFLASFQESSSSHLFVIQYGINPYSLKCTFLKLIKTFLSVKSLL